MTSPHRPNRCDTVLALIDECLADLEHSSAARLNCREERSARRAARSRR